MARILITTFGSYGDLHPYLAVALGLKRRGHQPIIATAAYYRPSHVFPRAAANVHQGGVGTLAQALHAGRPMLVVPFSHDQPDNADRAQHLGVARALPRARFSVRAGVSALSELLTEPGYATAAAAVAQTLRREDGVAAACDRLEAML